MKYFIYYLVIINIITFTIFSIDKIRAIKHKRRVPEQTLFLLSFLGGAYLEFLGMFLIRHKIRKIYFYIINIAFIILYTYIIYKIAYN